MQGTEDALNELESAPTPPGTGRRAAALAMLVAALVPIAVLVGSGAGFVLDPRERAWLTKGDSAQHLVAWSFYAREPWHWPPATIERWPAPLGTTIGLADAIPLVAMPLKALAGERAADLQYFGLWSAFCLAALGATSALFLLEARGGPLLAALGGGLLALSPVVWDRLDRGHPSLGAQALLVAMFVVWLRFFRRQGRWQDLVPGGTLSVLAAAVHPYLGLMTLTLLFAAVLFGAFRFGLRAVPRWLPVVVLAVAGSVAVAWLAGFLSLPARDLAVGGFGGNEADLLAFLNSAGFAKMVPALFDAGPRREGFSYLGLGLLVLSLAGGTAALVARSKRRPVEAGSVHREPVPGLVHLMAAGCALAAFGLTPRLSIAGVEVLDFSPVVQPLFEPAYQIVRATGRMVWPLHLLVGLVSILAMSRFVTRRSLVAAALGGCLILQILDAPDRSWMLDSELSRSSPLIRRLSATLASYEGVDRLALVPAYIQSGARVHCGGDQISSKWIEPAVVAARFGMSFNSGYVARVDSAQAERACEESTIEEILTAPRIDTVYILSAREARVVQSRFDRIRCVRLTSNERICRVH